MRHGGKKKEQSEEILKCTVTADLLFASMHLKIVL